MSEKYDICHSRPLVFFQKCFPIELIHKYVYIEIDKIFLFQLYNAH
jgi:hypothetical protein